MLLSQIGHLDFSAFWVYEGMTFIWHSLICFIYNHRFN